MRILVWCLVFVSVLSCDADSSEIGTDFFSDGVLDYSLSDTCSVKLSTITFGKLNVNNSSRILLGSHIDSKLGRISSSSFFQIGPPSTIDLRGQDITFDYLAITLKYDTYSYYDTSSSMTLRAFKVAEKIEASDDGYLYNTDSFLMEDGSIGEITFSPRPNRDDSVEIKLSTVLGEDLFEKAKSGDIRLSSSYDFLKYFYGLAIVPDTAHSTCLLGFSKAPELRIYYKDRSTIPIQQKYVALTIPTGGIIFSSMDVNRENTALRNLFSENTKVSSSDTDNESFIQAGAGLALRIDIPYLRDLKQVSNFYLQQAILEVYVVKKSYTDFEPLPTSLTVYKIDKKNSLYELFESTPLLIEDIDLRRDTRYTLNVTSFVKEQMELQTPNENGLVFFMTNDYASSADRLYAAAKSSEYKTRLILYYATVNN
ncbi:MAG TPA: DUF4270 family protein [Chryseolinea sp.]|nr:DUF4270 family protein [Chryseolinea sp.]HPM30341.1 DUF4270 family protein [Chryseolinea sp.]